MREARCFVLVWSVVSFGCTGTIGADGVGGPDRGSPDEPGAPSSGGTGGSRPPISGKPGDPPTDTPAACTVRPGPVHLRRLSHVEYARTIRDLLGRTVTFPSTAPLDTPLHGFDNNKSALALSTAHVATYGVMADDLAAKVLTPEGAAAFLGCTPTGAGRGACLSKLVDDFGRRAFRRPVDPAEREAYTTLAAAAADDPDPLVAFRLVLSAMLQSPSFLFRVEVGEPDPARAGQRRLTGYELATRLAYLLWGTTPTVDLLDQAGRKQLDSADGVEAAARAMLKDGRAREGLERFYTQQIRLRGLDGVEHARPDWQALRNAMAEETRRVLADAVWGDGASFLGFLDAKHTWVDKLLAKHYGVAEPASGWARVDLSSNPQRRGFLTHASFLTMTAHTEITAPIVRGSFIQEVMLCNPPPPPPEGVPPAPESTQGKSVREVLAAHSKDSCAACHVYLDPLGFGLERYDLVGAYREKDAEGRPLTGKGNIKGADEPEFTGAIELATKLSAMPQVRACVATHLFRYGFGRDEGSDDACALDAIAGIFERRKFDLRETLVELARSDLFRYAGGER